MSKDFSEKDSQKLSKALSVKEGRGAKRACCKSKTVLSPKLADALTTSVQTDDDYLDFASCCCALLKDVCVQANLIQLHCHRDTLLASDICKAGDLSILNQQSKTSERKKKKVDLEFCLKKKVNIVEKEKIFYHGHCYHCPKISVTTQSLKDYFELSMKAVFENDSELFSLILSDLKKNSIILPILPIYIHNLCNNAILLNHQPRTVEKFLQITHSLYLNSNLYIQNEYFLKIINFAISCALTNLFTMFHLPEVIFSLQNYAAEILCDIVVKNPSLYSQLQSHILTKLIVPFTASQQKFISCLGSLTVADHLGLSTIASLMPYVFLSLPVNKQFLYKLTDNLYTDQLCAKNHFQMLREKLRVSCETIVKNSLYIAVSLPKISEQYKIVYSDNEEIKSEILPVNAELCCAILKHYGETFSLSLPPVVDIHNETVPAQNVFEMLSQSCKFEEEEKN